MRELRVEDALMYLDQVKMEFGNRPHIYNEFLHIMKTFKSSQIDTPGVIMRVTQLFQGNKGLILGFNTFLPEGFKIEIPRDGSGTVYYRVPGQLHPTPIHPNGGGGGGPRIPGLPGAGEMESQQQGGPGPGPGPGVGPGQQQQQQQQVPTPHGHQQMQQSQTPGPGPGGPGGQPQQGLMQNGSIQLGGQGQGASSQGGDPGVPGGGGFQQQQAQPPQQQLMPHFAQRDRGPRGLRLGLHQQLQNQQQQQVGVNVNVGQNADGLQGIPQQGLAQQRGGGGTIPGGPGGPGPNHNHNQHHGHNQPPQQQQQQQELPQPPVEFDHAINYVTTIKRRFASEPETYKKFLEILHTYQKEQRGIKEVLDEVSVLFADHPDLLKDFTYFLPDAVQDQAKLQLAAAVRAAENRRNALDSHKQIMNEAERQRPVQAPPQVQQPPRQQAPPPRTEQNDHVVFIQNPIPFGAKKGRSEEREREICRSAIYGAVSFDPVRAPRKHELTPSQAAAKYGRPRSIPESIVEPTTKEASFFERAKEHLNRRELGPDKAPGSRRHTPHTEFLKCLHLYGAGILSKDELLLLLRTLFVQGHAPKSGVNASGGINFQHIARAANQLLKEFEELLVSRGPYARQQSALKDKSKYGAITSKEWDPALSDVISPSYRSYPSDYPYEEFYTHSGQTEEDASVLNTTVVCVRNEKNVSSSKIRLLDSLEEYDGVRVRRNIYEEAMAKVEDERFEVDVAIETTSAAMRQVEPLAEEVTVLKENEEKEGQPIGRLHYELRPQSLHSNHIGAIARLYGDQGDEVIHHLMRNPISVLPIVFKRLKEKDSEWRRVRVELTKHWRLICESNYEASLDVTCYSKRREIERSITSDQLTEACKRARYFFKNPKDPNLATSVIEPTYSAQHADPKNILFQTHLSTRATPDMPHKDVYDCIALQILNSAAKTNADREKSSRLWTEFVLPWFQLPTHWFLGELRDKARSEKSSCIVKYAPGQMVKTAFGDGRILSFTEAGSTCGARYKVALPFGTGHIRPSSIVHHLPPTEKVQYARMGGFMELIEAADEPMDGEQMKRLESSCRLVFGTEKVYIFMRLYCAILALFDSIKRNISNVESRDMDIDDEGKEKAVAGYRGFVSTLKDYINEDIQFKTYELNCRSLTKQKPYELSAVPRLIEKCADALVKVAKEDKLLGLFDFYQLKHMDPVLQRAQSLDFSEEAVYRIQYDATDGFVHFSYLPLDKKNGLLTFPKKTGGAATTMPGTERTNTSINGVHANNVSKGGEDGGMRIDDTTGIEPQSKRVKLM